MTTVTLDDRELATVLAALRLWQKNCAALDETDLESMWPDYWSIATNVGDFAHLGADDVDALCERINCPAPKPARDDRASYAILAQREGFLGTTLPLGGYVLFDQGDPINFSCWQLKVVTGGWEIGPPVSREAYDRVQSFAHWVLIDNARTQALTKGRRYQAAVYQLVHNSSTSYPQPE